MEGRTSFPCAYSLLNQEYTLKRVSDTKPGNPLRRRKRKRARLAYRRLLSEIFFPDEH